MTSQREKCAALEKLHRGSETFVIANPWDAGSAAILQGLGFKALATTSSGFAYSLGRIDGDVTLEEKLAHCRELSAATHIPISADFENGFADDPDGVLANVRRLSETGVAGCSIEDYSRDEHVLYDVNHAVERIEAAVRATSDLDMAFQLVARAENHIRGVDDLGDTIRRLKSYEKAGAHVLYAPGLATLEQVRQVTSELSAPVNVLASTIPSATVEQLAAAGATRISLGGALCWATVAPLIQAGHEMLEDGTFGWLQGMAQGSEIRRLLGRPE